MRRIHALAILGLMAAFVAGCGGIGDEGGRVPGQERRYE